MGFGKNNILSGVRNIVAECLGHLLVLAPATKTVFYDLIQHESVSARATAVTAVRFAAGKGTLKRFVMLSVSDAEHGFV